MITNVGKLGEETNWQKDYFIQCCVTIGNQFEILMLIEMLEFEGISVVSANTDGIVCLFDKELEDTYYKICKEWEKIVGNEDLGQLEYCDYLFLAQTSVNDYIAQSTDGSIKQKGEFLTEFEIHKNKSKRIVPLALEQYFVNGIKPEVFIKNHKDIFDFCLAIKGNSDSKFYLVNLLSNKKEQLQKINRFYISNSKDILIKELPKLESKKASMQIDIFGEVDNGERISNIEVGYNVTIFNKFLEKDDYDINYNYYISKCYEIINKIIK